MASRHPPSRIPQNTKPKPQAQAQAQTSTQTLHNQLKSYTTHHLDKLGFSGLQDVFDYIMTLPRHEMQSYWISLLGESQEVVDFVKGFLDQVDTYDRMVSGHGSSNANNASNGNGAAGGSTTSTNPSRQGQRTDTKTKTKSKHAIPTNTPTDSETQRKLEAYIARNAPLNCLQCGYIHKPVPTKPACTYCNASLLENMDQWSMASLPESAASKNASPLGSNVVEDSMDYYAETNNPWVSAQDQQRARELLQARDDLKDEAKIRRRNREIKMKIVGDRVVLEEDQDEGGWDERNADELLAKWTRYYERDEDEEWEGMKNVVRDHFEEKVRVVKPA